MGSIVKAFQTCFFSLFCEFLQGLVGTSSTNLIIENLFGILTTLKTIMLLEVLWILRTCQFCYGDMSLYISCKRLLDFKVKANNAMEGQTICMIWRKYLIFSACKINMRKNVSCKKYPSGNGVKDIQWGNWVHLKSAQFSAYLMLKSLHYLCLISIAIDDFFTIFMNQIRKNSI